MNTLALIAITWIGKEYRFFGLDWSYLMVLGFIGNALFSMRFLVQWLASERQGESVIPVSFWYWSIAGSVLMCVYFIFRRDPVGIIRVSPKLTDLHPQLNADSEAQVRFHCRGAFPAPARDGIGAAAADFETVQLVSEWQVACRIHAIPQTVNSPLSNPWPCGCVRDRWDDRKR